MCNRLPRSIWSKQIASRIVDSGFGLDLQEDIFTLSKVMPWIIPDLIEDNIVKVVRPDWFRYYVFTMQLDSNDITMLETIMRVLKRHGNCDGHIYHIEMYYNGGFTTNVVRDLHRNAQNYCTVYHHWREYSLRVTIKTFDIDSMVAIVHAMNKRKVHVLSGPNAILTDPSSIHTNPTALYVMSSQSASSQGCSKKATTRMTLCETVNGEGTVWQSISKQLIVV